MKALFEAEAVEGLNYPAFISRIKSGFSFERALTEQMNNVYYRKYSVDGKVFNNLKELANAAKISYDAAVKRSHRGWNDTEIYYGKKKNIVKKLKEKKPRGVEVEVNGIVYENIRYAFESLSPKCCLNTLKARLRYGWSYEEALEVTHRVDGRKKIDDANKIFLLGTLMSLGEASERSGVPKATIKDRVNRGATPEQAIGLNEIVDGELQTQTVFNKNRPKRIKKEFIVDGVIYTSIKILAHAYDMPYKLVYNRIHKYGWTPERAIKENVGEVVVVRGQAYRSAMSAWESIGKTNSSTYHSRRSNGYSIEVSLGLEPLPSELKFEINGVLHESLQEVAQAYNLTKQQLTYRLNFMSIEDAVIYRPSNGRYTLKAFNRNPELANTAGMIYFVKISLTEGVLHKIGITQKQTSQRLISHDFELILEFSGRLEQLYEIEQEIVKVFSDCHYPAEKDFEGRTETFLLMENEEKEVMDFMIRKSQEINCSSSIYPKYSDASKVSDD